MPVFTSSSSFPATATHSTSRTKTTKVTGEPYSDTPSLEELLYDVSQNKSDQNDDFLNKEELILEQTTYSEDNFLNIPNSLCYNSQDNASSVEFEDRNEAYPVSNMAFFNKE